MVLSNTIQRMTVPCTKNKQKENNDFTQNNLCDLRYIVDNDYIHLYNREKL